MTLRNWMKMVNKRLTDLEVGKNKLEYENDELKYLKKKLEVDKFRLYELETIITNRDSKIDQLQQELAKMEQNRDIWSADCKARIVDNNKLRIELANIKNDLADLVQSRDAWYADYKDQKEQVKKLSSELAAPLVDYAKKCSEVATLKYDLNKLQKDKKHLEMEFTTRVKELEQELIVAKLHKIDDY